MLFNAVVMNFPTSTFFKILSIMQSVHSPTKKVSFGFLAIRVSQSYFVKSRVVTRAIIVCACVGGGGRVMHI